MKRVLDYLIDCFKSKTYGFYVSLVSMLLMFVLIFIYPNVPEDLYSQKVGVTLIIGVVIFTLLMFNKETTKLCPIPLMVCSILSLVFFAQSDGFIDYFSTQFFSGISLKIIFGLPFPVLYTLLATLFGFIISSVSFYLPKNKKEKVEEGGNKNEK